MGLMNMGSNVARSTEYAKRRNEKNKLRDHVMVVNSLVRGKNWQDTTFGGIDLLHDEDGIQIRSVFVKFGEEYKFYTGNVNKIALVSRGELYAEDSHGNREQVLEGGKFLFKANTEYVCVSGERGMQFLLINSTSF